MIRVENLEIQFDNISLLHDLSFQLNEGEKMSITGKSGSGKSSLLKALIGFVDFSKGSIYIDNMALIPGNEWQIRKITSYVPQDIWTPFEWVKDFVYFPLSFKTNQNANINTESLKEIMEYLSLPMTILSKRIKHVSGGEKQRLALCSSLLLNKKLLLWDEPTSALDKETKQGLLNYLHKNNKISLISSSHDPEWVESMNKNLNMELYR